MANKTTLQVISQGAGGDEITTTISNANPEAADGALYNFAVALNSLTQNDFVNAKRIDETVLQAGD